MRRAYVYLAAILIVVNAATGQQTTQSPGPRNTAPVLLVLLYLTTVRRSWIAWLLLEAATATLGIICAFGTPSSTTVAGVLALGTTAAVFPLEPSRRQSSRTDGSSSDGGLKVDVIAVNPGHD